MECMDEDFLLALELQEQLDKESWQPPPQPTVKPNSTLSIVDESWENIDPNPDIRELFLQFNKEFFWGRLAGIEVKWSPRMTLCAGLCVYEGRGGLCSVRLSLPLLKLRPRRDLVETLLHEMIHAYLFVTDNNKDHDGHGPEFHKHMYRLNNATGTKISVYHNFIDEVDQYRQHWWRCNGPCQTKKPFFGYVKRAMNRAPSERDPWWNNHKMTCNGTYVKIKEPEGYGKKKSKGKSDKSDKVKSSQNEKSETDEKKGNPDIRSFLGKGQVLHSGKPQQKVIVNGVLTTSGKSDKKSDTSLTKPCPSSSGKENEDSVLQPRTSVSAIITAGKISDKELLRQQKFAELMLSDSDDEDLILCDQPEPGRDSENNVIITKSKGIISETSSPNKKIKSNTINTTELESESEMNFECGKPSHITNSPRTSIKSKNNDALSDSTKSYKSDTKVSIYNSEHIGISVNSKSGSNDVVFKVRSVWANKQFGSSLKPLDPKADSLNFIPNKGKGSSSNKRLSVDDSNGQFRPGVKSSNKRLSGEDATGSRKKLKHESGQGFKINDMFSNIPTMQSESSESSVASCPVCNKSVPSSQINQHLDICLGIS